uniref:BPTI/Kunitz inhibitor domain-containing protein n=1 Tax=Oreochromis niloticus TaxID=8128 RepID=A0A669CYK4_ORENI
MFKLTSKILKLYFRSLLTSCSYCDLQVNNDCLLFLPMVFTTHLIPRKYFCLLPPDVGQGTSFTFAVHYDVNKDQCTPFLYNGQGGNANRFENERECMRNCSPNAENIYPMDGCTLEKAEGECNGKYLRYYYDSIDKKYQCSPFIYKGEGGNANRFENEAECMRNCSPNAENIYPMDACLLKRTEGGCNGNCVKYYYDSRDEKCKEFIWTGCFGNGNRFHDYNSCNSTCSGVKGKNSHTHLSFTVTFTLAVVKQSKKKKNP